ncbi:hypothetical protein AAC387_Pa11g1102 [Persea americana]
MPIIAGTGEGNRRRFYTTIMPRCKSPETLFTVVVASCRKCFSVVGEDNRKKNKDKEIWIVAAKHTWVLGIARSRRRRPELSHCARASCRCSLPPLVACVGEREKKKSYSRVSVL